MTSLAIDTMEQLFAYGTLQLESVQLETFARRLDGTPDALAEYRVVMMRITDEEFIAKNGSAEQRSLQFTGNESDSVEGMVFDLTADDLKQADAYEPEDYKRVLVQLRSGIKAWVYLSNAPSEHR